MSCVKLLHVFHESNASSRTWWVSLDHLDPELDAVADFRREPGVSLAAEAIEKEEFSGILFYVL